MWIRQATPTRRAAVRRDDAKWLRERVVDLATPRHALAEAS